MSVRLRPHPFDSFSDEFRDSTTGGAPGSEPGGWRFESFSLSFDAILGKEVIRAMQDVDWNLAIARLIFVQGHIRQMRKEIAMKNEKFADAADEPSPHADEARQVPAARLLRPWPARRRFWHRAFHRPAQPKAPRAAQQLEPAE